MTLISLRLDLISHCLLRDIQLVTWPSYSTATHTIYPKVESAIKAPLSNIFHTNIESNDFMQSEMFAHAANYTDNEHTTLGLYKLFYASGSVLPFYMVESEAANEWLIKKS